jgi:hypothetical protein
MEGDERTSGGKGVEIDRVDAVEDGFGNRSDRCSNHTLHTLLTHTHTHTHGV